jgi:flagellar biosynthesis/type III secretory pathway protein FliH
VDVSTNAKSGPSFLAPPPGGPIGPIGAFLERFRRTGGVPATVGEQARTELEPVFAALDEIEREVEELRNRSVAAAARHAREAEEEAEMVLAEARSRAEAEREDAYLAGLRAADAEASRILHAARLRADAIEREGRARLPRLIQDALARVFEERAA